MSGTFEWCRKCGAEVPPQEIGRHVCRERGRQPESEDEQLQRDHHDKENRP